MTNATPSTNLRLYRVAFRGMRRGSLLVDESRYVLAVSERAARQVAHGSLGKSDPTFINRYYECDSITSSAEVQREPVRREWP